MNSNIYYRVVVVGDFNNTIATTGYYKTSKQAVAVAKQSYPNHSLRVQKHSLHWTELLELAKQN
jgi:hypothetical protein